jgi:5-methylcytosine-specific restriction endonuclease McrA
MLTMCRNADWCTELDPNPKKWSKACPLQPPKYFNQSLNAFVKAFRAAEVGDKDVAIKLLGDAQGQDLRNWYIEHGQMSGWHYRVKALKKPKPKKYTGELEKNKSFARYESQVYQRDGYRCGYCGIRVIDTKALLKMEKIVGKKYFKVKGKNNERHGVALVLRATIDHIKPLSRGGRTRMDNLITSCWSCNYGKLNSTLEQLGISNPLKKPSNPNRYWNGLMP